jgi:hypothetical protein
MLGPSEPEAEARALAFLVPKLCLGTQVAKLCFASAPLEGEDAKQSFATLGGQAELGHQECSVFFMSFVTLW